MKTGITAEFSMAMGVLNIRSKGVMLSSNTNPRSNLVSFRSCTLLCAGSALGLSRGVCSDYA
jgi:hypothetical protein